MLLKTFVLIIFIALFFFATVQGQVKNYGILTGTVQELKTDEPLPGVNIILLRTVMGATTLTA
jgi:hypothetical protein